MKRVVSLGLLFAVGCMGYADLGGSSPAVEADAGVEDAAAPLVDATVTPLPEAGVIGATGDSSVDSGLDAGPLHTEAATMCGPNGWCWSHPYPQGNVLWGTWGTSASDVWAVGEYGTAIHYDGQSWSLHTTDAHEQLRSVHGTASNNVWASATAARSSTGTAHRGRA